MGRNLTHSIRLTLWNIPWAVLCLYTHLYMFLKKIAGYVSTCLSVKGWYGYSSVSLREMHKAPSHPVCSVHIKRKFC